MASQRAASTLSDGEHHFPRPRGADQPRQQPRDAVVAAEPHAQIAGERTLIARRCGYRRPSRREAGADRRPRQCRDVGLRTETSAPVSSRWRSCRSATFSSCDMSSFFWSRWAPMPLTLPPAQKAVPAPVINSAPISRFFAAGPDHGAQRRSQLVRHRVARFRPVQRDDGDAVADRAEEFIGAGIDFGFRCCHDRPSFLLSFRGGAKHRTRNLGRFAGLVLRTIPE